MQELITKEAINITVNNPLGTQIISWIISLIGPAIGAILAFWGANKMRILTQNQEKIKMQEVKYRKLLENFYLFRASKLEYPVFKAYLMADKDSYTSDLNLIFDNIIYKYGQGIRDERLSEEYIALEKAIKISLDEISK